MNFGIAGKRVAFTGTFRTFSRQELKQALADAGAKVASSVGKTTELLFYGDKPSSKLGEAQRRGIPAGSERELLQALGRPFPQPQLSGPLADFVPRFEAMVAELEAHPRVHIVNSWVSLPVQDKALAKVEKRLGTELAPAIRNFYRQADGLSLRWIVKDADFDRWAYRRRWGPDSLGAITDDSGACQGCVRIAPLEEAFLKDWKDLFWFDWMQDSEQQEFAGAQYGQRSFHQALKVFDWFNFYNMMAMLVLPGVADPAVLMGDDHGACFTDSRVTDFETYLEGVLGTYASVQSRRDSYGVYAGHRQPPLREAPSLALGSLLPQDAGSATRALTRSQLVTAEGSFRKEGEGWTRFGDGLGEALGADKGGNVVDLAFDPEGQPLVATRRSVWRLLADGSAEQLFRGPQKLWGKNLAVSSDGTVLFGASDRLVVIPTSGKARSFSGKKVLIPGDDGDVYSLASAPDGSVWVGLRSALAVVRAGQDPQLDTALHELLAEASGEPSDALAPDGQGGLWLLHHNHLVHRSAGGVVRSVSVGDRHPYTSDLLPRPDGSVVLVSWGLRDHAVLLRPGADAVELWSVLTPVAAEFTARAAVDATGRVWVMSLPGQLCAATDTQLLRCTWADQVHPAVQADPSRLRVKALRFAPDGALWVAMEGGLYKVPAEQLT